MNAIETERREPDRCDRCNWPLSASFGDGCTAGNCSQRPLLPTRAERMAEARRQQRAQGNVQELVREFHEAFGQPIVDKPTVPSKERCVLRAALTLEEQLELLVGLGDDHDEPIKKTVAHVCRRLLTSEQGPDIVQVADAIGDALYVLYGTAIEFGIDMGPVVKEIHAANLRKLGPDGKPLYDENGKVKKPEGWVGPDIAGVLKAQGWDGT